MTKNDTFQDFLDDLETDIPFYTNKNSKCKISFEKGKNNILISDLTIPSRFLISSEDDTYSALKKFSSKNIFISLYEEEKLKKEQGLVSIYSYQDLSMSINLFIEEKLFSFLISSIENSGKDFLQQLKFSIPILSKDLKNIKKNINENKGYKVLLKNYRVIFSTDD